MVAFMESSIRLLARKRLPKQLSSTIGSQRWRFNNFSSRAEDFAGSTSDGGLPSWVKVTGGLAGAGLLLTFHFMMISQRQQQEAHFREKIAALQEEVSDLKSKLREAEKARFRRKSKQSSDIVE
eukprot:TRINITY_DN5024_c1_g2_i1.p1 TRINITY_DN5024_c1_g2~~TRINITY_DN5024_c1_g2_i1.p1  ORF type:complete len:124 (+),score=35.05 TRINITY_DN5024_c1_g2_i1:28-399(+)